MKKRIVSTLLICAMVIGTFAGCGKNEAKTETKESTATSESKQESTPAKESETVVEEKEREHVELVVYNFTQSAEQPGTEEAMEAVNEYLKEKLNTTLDIHLYATAATYKETVPTMLAGGTYMDMVLVGSEGVPFATYAQQEAFLPLEDYIDEYLPETKAQVPESAWDAFSWNGHVYAVPVFKDFASQQDVVANASLVEELGLGYPEKYDTYWDIIDWLYEVKAARDAKYPELKDQPITKWRGYKYVFPAFYYYDPIVANDDMVVANFPGLAGFEGMGEGETVFCPYYTPEYRKAVKQMSQLVADKVVPYDRSAFDTDSVMSKAGQLIATFSSGYVYYDENANKNFKSKLLRADNAIITTSSLTPGGYAITNQCENVERALEVIDLIASDPYLATLWRFGPEGTNWVDENNDNVVEWGPANSGDTVAYKQWYGWNFGGLGVTKVQPGQPGNLGELLKELNDSGTVSANIGFAMNQEPVVNEIAACSNVIAEYHSVLMQGQATDPDKMVDEFVAKLKASGMDKIVAEAQKQLDEWKKAN